MKSQFIQDVEAFAKEMAVRLPKTHEGGIIIMATDNNDIAKCIIARPSHLKELVEHMLTCWNRCFRQGGILSTWK